MYILGLGLSTRGWTWIALTNLPLRKSLMSNFSVPCLFNGLEGMGRESRTEEDEVISQTFKPWEEWYNLFLGWGVNVSIINKNLHQQLQ